MISGDFTFCVFSSTCAVLAAQQQGTGCFLLGGREVSYLEAGQLAQHGTCHLYFRELRHNWSSEGDVLLIPALCVSCGLLSAAPMRVAYSSLSAWGRACEMCRCCIHAHSGSGWPCSQLCRCTQTLSLSSSSWRLSVREWPALGLFIIHLAQGSSQRSGDISVWSTLEVVAGKRERDVAHCWTTECSGLNQYSCTWGRKSF